jgi:anti-sigma regulatory factor (Ser/Thr protein kinase)
MDETTEARINRCPTARGLRDQWMVTSSKNRTLFAVPVDRSYAAVVRQEVRLLVEGAGIAADATEDLMVALGEAFSNAVIHGTGTRSDWVVVSGRVSTLFAGAGCQVALELRYPGDLFDTTPPDEPSVDELSGRGRFLMETLMDSVTYTFPPGETVVRLEVNTEGSE